MQRKFLLVCAGFALSLTLHGQTSAALETGSLDNSLSSNSPVTNNNNGDWTFYLDRESKVYYIDFETIPVNLNDIKVTNSEGEVILTDNLWDLPVNTIYELDFGKQEPGKYEIELRTYTGAIRKDIVIE
jgi:hypothetical protein